jgi:hypothetical protein
MYSSDKNCSRNRETKVEAILPAESIPLALRSLQAVVAVLLVSAQAVQAQETESQWDIHFSPYLWGSSLSGSVATVPGIPETEIDASFSDILDNLDFGLMGALTARKGQYGLFGDLMYIKLSADAPTPGPGYDSASAEVTNLVLTFGGDYLLSKTNSTEIRAAAGIRYWNIETELGFSGGVAPDISVSGSDDWVDGLGGLIWQTDLNGDTFLTGWAFAGAGGAEFMSDLFAGVGYRISERTALVGGYRYLSVDRRNGDFIYDVEQAGLMIGMNIGF